MKKKRYTEEQIIRILREAEKGEKAIGEVCREQGIAEATFYRWRNKYGGMEVSEARRLREMERENARMKRIIADLTLENDAIKELLGKKL